jgi:RNA polymerase subunit RPABC4/transcription elongation factor Spt4
MYCKYCGTLLPDGSNTCAKCSADDTEKPWSATQFLMLTSSDEGIVVLSNDEETLDAFQPVLSDMVRMKKRLKRTREGGLAGLNYTCMPLFKERDLTAAAEALHKKAVERGWKEKPGTTPYGTWLTRQYTRVTHDE